MEKEPVIGYAAIGNTKAFPEDIVKQVRSRGLELLKTLSKSVIEIPLFINSFEQMQRAVRQINDAQVDILIMNICTWVEAGVTIRFFRELRGRNIILWSFAARVEILPLTALIEITSTITKLGYKFLTLLGTPDARSTVESLKSLISVFTSIQRVSNARVGLIGYNSPGMVDSTPDEISLRKCFGTELVHLDLHEVLSYFEKANASEAKTIAKSLVESVGACEVSHGEVMLSAKLYLGLKETVLKHELSAFAIRCWPELKGNLAGLSATPCYALSRLTDEGVIGACEADISSAITMLLMKNLSGRLPVVLDFNTFIEPKNALTFWHCGAHATSIVNDMRAITLRHPSEGGQKEVHEGMALECSLPPGAATLAKINREYTKILASPIHFTKPSEEFRGGIAEGILETSAAGFIEAVIKEGIEHHVCAVYMDIVKELKLSAKLLDIKIIEF
jgi:L-fucose isomerase-like protein